MIFDVMKANDDAADIVCNECKSVIATLHGPSAHRASVRIDRAEKARAMAGQEIDRLSDPSATEEEGGDDHDEYPLHFPRRHLAAGRRKHRGARRRRGGLSGRTRHLPRRLPTLAGRAHHARATLIKCRK
jgi:hypothetical protein